MKHFFKKLKKNLLETVPSYVQAVLDEIDHGIFVFDKNQELVFVNSALLEITGLSRDSFSVTQCTAMIKKKSSGKMRSSIDLAPAISAVLSNGTSIRVESLALGNRVYDVSVVPIIAVREPIGGAVIMKDVTRVKQVDRVKAEFMRVASHKLRTPLTSVNWYIEILSGKEVGPLTDSQREYVRKLYNETQKMTDIVNTLLNVSRLEAGMIKVKPKSLYAHTFVQKILDEIREKAVARKCEITFQHAKKIPRISFDPILLGQAFRQIVKNAISYASSSRLSKIAVSVQMRDGKEGERLEISVRDNGVGIPKTAQDEICGKFYRAENASQMDTEGLGLGLYMVKLIMDSLGGSLDFDSIEGKGSTFFLRVPARTAVAKDDGDELVGVG